MRSALDEKRYLGQVHILLELGHGGSPTSAVQQIQLHNWLLVLLVSGAATAPSGRAAAPRKGGVLGLTVCCESSGRQPRHALAFDLHVEREVHELCLALWWPRPRRLRCPPRRRAGGEFDPSSMTGLPSMVTVLLPMRSDDAQCWDRDGNRPLGEGVKHTSGTRRHAAAVAWTTVRLLTFTLLGIGCLRSGLPQSDADSGAQAMFGR